MTDSTLLEFIDSLENLTKIWCIEAKKLIYDKLNCLYCASAMVFKAEQTVELGFRWQSVNKKCDFYRTKRSLLAHSFIWTMN